MKKAIFFILLSLIFTFGLFSFTFAEENEIEINFFYSKICPHCAKEKEFLKELASKYPGLNIKQYEVISHPENKKILQDFLEKYQVPKQQWGLVPATFTPDKYFIGFNQQIAKGIESCLEACLNEGEEISETIEIPILGEINLSKMSLPVITVVLGALDGFNPCAMWVLLFLIILLLSTRSRKRMWLIGGTFILASGVVYFLILSAWLNLFLAISYVNLTRIIIGVFALAFGIWQIKNFIKFRPGVCKVTDGESRFKDRIKNGLKNHVRKLALSPLTIGILIGIIVLAVGVNLVEFFCSAGIPAIFTRVLTLSKLNSLSYYLYLLLYTLVFMLDDLIILSVAAITLSKITFSEKYSYWATLIGGLLMFILGALLIFRPQILMFG